MDKLKLIQQLYEPESSDFAPAELSREEQLEMESLLSVKRALDAMPRVRPEADTVRAIMREASSESGRSAAKGFLRPLHATGLRLVVSRTLPRVAAIAATVVIAVGVALWMRQPAPGVETMSEMMEPEEELGRMADMDMKQLAEAPAVSDSIMDFNLEWDDTEDLRTLYWQVEALHERSAERLWDASVPLESRPIDAWEGADANLHHVGAQR
jgi:hypothetical protein